MSIANKVLNFGNSKRGKIISWSIVLFSTLFFFGGILLNVIPKMTAEKFAGVELSAENMRYRQTFTGINKASGQNVQYYNSYYLTISKRQTFVSTKSLSPKSKEEITFSTTSPFITFEWPKILAGEMAIINLAKSNDRYGFSDPNERVGVDDIKVTIADSENKPIATIFVRIVLNDEDFELTAVLESRVAGDKTDGGEWIEWSNWSPLVSGVETLYFIYDGVQYGQTQYRVRVTLKIWGDLFFDTVRDGYESVLYRELYTLFDGYPSYNESGHSIDTLLLFNHDGGDIVDIGFGITAASINKNITIHYNIGVDFDGKYFTKNNFKINIMVP
jgi:hypothetical protein